MSSTQPNVLYFIIKCGYVSRYYIVILSPQMHKPKLQLHISFWVRMRSQSVVQRIPMTFKGYMT